MALLVGSWHTAGWIGLSPAVRLKRGERAHRKDLNLGEKWTGADENARLTIGAGLRSQSSTRPDSI